MSGLIFGLRPEGWPPVPKPGDYKIVPVKAAWLQPDPQIAIDRAKRAEAVRLHAAGASTREIADLLGYTHTTTVLNVVKRERAKVAR